MTAMVSLVVLLAGCVIPIGPEFESEPNLSPYWISADPPINSRITADAENRLPTINLTVGDPNLGDRLFIRWIFDYPLWDTTSRMYPEERGPSVDGKPERTPLQFSPNCRVHALQPGLRSHRMTVAVSDRPFVTQDEGAPLDFLYTTIRAGAHLWQASWVLDVECPPP